MTSSGKAWTLIARFSNNDAKSWMEDSGEWWYDKSVVVGDIADPSVNTAGHALVSILVGRRPRIQDHAQ